MLHRRVLAIAVLFAAMLLSVLPFRGAAQSGVEFFEQVINGEVSAPLLAGPFDFTLEQSPGTLSAYRAGIDTRNFVAHAAFANPAADSEIAWDYGFQFRTTGDNEDLRIFVTSDGTWSFSVGVDPPDSTVVAPNLDTTPGAVNTLDLIVDEFQAIFGINGEFVGVLALPEIDPTGDVYASTGFLSDLVVPGRTIELSEFAVYEVPSAETGSAEALPDAQAAIDTNGVPRPVSLNAGSCDDLGPVVETLTDATYPAGDFAGQESAVVALTSFTRVTRLLDELLQEPFAINVAQSADAPEVSIACGDVGGIVDEIGGHVIVLAERGESGYFGIAYLDGDDDLGRTNLSVFVGLTMGSGAVPEPLPALAPSPPAEAIATASADASADSSSQGEASSGAPADPSAAELEPAATPVAAAAATPIS